MISEFDYLKHLTEGYPKSEIIKKIAETHGKDIWNYAYSIAGNATMADDITQDVLLKVMEKIQTFRGASSMKTWLLSITRNTAYTIRYKQQVKRFISFGQVDEQLHYPSAERVVMDKLDMNEAWEAVMTLPVKYREVLVLFGYHEMSMKQISETLGVPEGTVKSRLHHARIKLARWQERMERRSHGDEIPY